MDVYDEYLKHGTINGIHKSTILGTGITEDSVMKQFLACNTPWVHYTDHVCDATCTFWSSSESVSKAWYVCRASGTLHKCGKGCDYYYYEGGTHCKLTHHVLDVIMVATTGSFESEVFWEPEVTRPTVSRYASLGKTIRKIIDDVLFSPCRTKMTLGRTREMCTRIKEFLNKKTHQHPYSTTELLLFQHEKLTPYMQALKYKIPSRSDPNINRVCAQMLSYVSGLSKGEQTKDSAMLLNETLLIKSILYAMKEGIQIEDVTFIESDEWLDVHLPGYNEVSDVKIQNITKTIRLLKFYAKEAYRSERPICDFDYLFMKRLSN